MSTVVAIEKEGVICLGADTLSKYGDSNESAALVDGFTKIVPLGENHLAFVGPASFGLILESYFSRLEEPPVLNSKQAIFEFVRQMHPVLKKEYYLNSSEDDDDALESSQAEYLVVNPSGIYGVYAQRFVQKYRTFYAFGSGAQFALGAMYSLADSTIGAEAIAKRALKAASEFDDGTAGPFEFRQIPRRDVSVTE